ncbi:MAG TPA: PAS domain S-box protein [Planctomycetaceae bacterium]|jgi:PAS domain S-box-containing protein
MSQPSHATTEDAERLRVTLASIGDGVISTDDHGRVAFVNPVAEALTGWKETDARGKPLSEVFRIVNELTGLPAENPVERVLREGITLGLANHTMLIARDGRATAIDDSAAPIRDAQGNIRGVVFVFRNVTERRKLEVAAGRLAAIVESSDDGIISKSLDGIITTWNASAERIFGYAATEAIGQPISILAPKDHLDEMPDILARIRRGQRIDHFETIRCRKDGTRIHVSVSISPIRNEHNEVIGASKTVRDITERLRAEEQLQALLLAEQSARAEAERANRMKDEFLATVSHEILTPLNAILGWAHLLRTGQLTTSETQEALDIIERNTRDQARIIEDILDMSRIVSGKIALDFGPVELQSVIEAALATVRPAAEAKGIILDSELDSTTGPVLGDAGRLQQVVWNILSNAIKFTPKAGRVELRLSRVGSNIVTSITDTGVGIGSDLLPYVFDRFRQADSSSRRIHGGLGLGLAIAKQLVDLHGGQITVSSSGEGKGSRFVVALPVRALQSEQEPNENAVAPFQPSAPSPSLLNLTVLVVDDDNDSLRLVQRLLMSQGAAVVTASSAGEAFDLLREYRPHVLISDIGMPNEDGYDLMKRVRSLDSAEGGDTPAAALTAFARSEDRTRALLAGYQTHVVKPVDPSELIAVVAALAGRTGR